jgi:hypothetical protein
MGFRRSDLKRELTEMKEKGLGGTSEYTRIQQLIEEYDKEINRMHILSLGSQ